MTKANVHRARIQMKKTYAFIHRNVDTIYRTMALLKQVFYIFVHGYGTDSVISRDIFYAVRGIPKHVAYQFALCWGIHRACNRLYKGCL